MTGNNEDETSFDEFSEGTLEHMREDAIQTLELSIRKHDAHQKKAIQMVQINGVVISILIAAASQIPRPFQFNLLLYIGPAAFLLSAVSAGFALRGHELDAGISPTQITKNINSRLTETQYLIWYLNAFYQDAIIDVNDKTATRAKRVRVSVYLFLAGLIVTTGGIIIWLGPDTVSYV